MTLGKFVLFTSLLTMATTAFAELYTVKPGDNLWKIASQHTHGHVTTHQMIAAIHNENTNVLGDEIGHIRPGMVLNVPSMKQAAGADTALATSLLAGSSATNNMTDAQARALMVKIDNLQNDINKTIQDIERTKTHFDKALKQ